jgi:sensor histidine kinase YesM
MKIKRVARLVLPILIAIIIVTGISIYAAVSQAATPHPQGGVLNLAEWDKKGAFELSGEWEFYWGKALTGAQIEGGAERFALVEAPSEWIYYETEFGELPAFGVATYRVHVTGAQPGTEYGFRIQNQASAYRLYADDELIAENGTFGDTSDAPASEYRPQLGAFTAKADSFNIILQVSNHAYAGGGMWEPVLFGTYEQAAAFNAALSDVGMFSLGGLAFVCLFFVIFFAAQRREKDMLILAGIGVLVILRLLITGDMLSTYLFPNLPISGYGWIDYLTLIWIQFLLYYFVYRAYGGLARKWQIIALFAYCGIVTLCLIVLPFEVIMSAYMVLNFILLFVTVFVTAQLGRAAWRGQTGAPALLGAMAFILLFLFYDLFIGLWPAGYYLLTATSIDYMALFIAYCFVVARRYRRAQQLEMSFLKGQIRPHFIHNSLNTIISISRGEAERARDLLSDFSVYLRGYYDYDTEEQIALGQELELVRAYAALEQARFGERVKVEYDIESERLLLPPIILQPLVENAFVHGLREKAGGGTVVVYAKRTAKGSALVGVRDDGVGLCAKAPTERNGVGVENINRRLTRMYRTQLVFTVPEGGGCDVHMEIPWKEADKDARIHR